jgi:hypothetical protein
MFDSLLTRRNWAALVAAVPMAAQIASTPPAPAPSPADDARKTSEQLAQIEIPMSLEPAFLFRA